jgi:hypothetical protein
LTGEELLDLADRQEEQSKGCSPDTPRSIANPEPESDKRGREGGRLKFAAREPDKAFEAERRIRR